MNTNRKALLFTILCQLTGLHRGPVRKPLALLVHHSSQSSCFLSFATAILHLLLLGRFIQHILNSKNTPTMCVGKTKLHQNSKVMVSYVTTITSTKSFGSGPRCMDILLIQRRCRSTKPGSYFINSICLCISPPWRNIK